MQGPGDTNQDADHENASLDEEDEEEDGEDNGEDAEHEVGSDESGDEYDDNSPRPSTSLAPSRHRSASCSPRSIVAATPQR